MESDKISVKKRLDQRLHDAYLLGLRARKFTPEQMLKQGGELIAFSLKLHKHKQSGEENN